MGPRAGAENLAPDGIRSPDRPARSSVAIPTELSGPRTQEYVIKFTEYFPLFYNDCPCAQHENM